MQQGSDVKQAIINNRSNKELRCLLFEATYNTPVVVEARARGESHPSTNANIGLLSYHKLVRVVFPNVLHWLTKHIFFARDAQSDSSGQCRCQSSPRSHSSRELDSWHEQRQSLKIPPRYPERKRENQMSFHCLLACRVFQDLNTYYGDTETSLIYPSTIVCRNINHFLHTLQAISLFPPFNWGRSLTCPISVPKLAPLSSRHAAFEASSVPYLGQVEFRD